MDMADEVPLIANHEVLRPNKTEIVKRNPGLIKDILNALGIFMHVPYGGAYELYKTFPFLYSDFQIQSLTITKFEEIHNPYLKLLFELKRRDLNQVYSVYSSHLYHGTRNSNGASISEKNFNYRFAGRRTGTAWGKGVFFSADLKHASRFSDNIYLAVNRNTSDWKKRTIFYCEVLIGSSHIGANNLLIPEEGFDTTDNGKGTVCVKYDDDVFYPQYKITFT